MRIPASSFLTVTLTLLLSTAAIEAAPEVHTRSGNSCPHGNSVKSKGWPKKFKNFVAFGDSFTDESRGIPWFSENKVPPPVGWEAPPSDMTSSGGKSWARFVAETTGSKLYNYAVYGATCSNLLTPRLWRTIDALFPSVLEYQLPAFLADHSDPKTGCMKLDPAETVYSVWIGTNDVGGGLLLSDEHVPNVSLPNVTSCVFDLIHALYEEAGARYFILQNIVPLEKAPLYTSGNDWGVYTGNNRFWTTKEAQFMGNGTKVEEKMRMLVRSANEIYEYRAPAEILGGTKLKGAKLAVFDSYGLFNDMMDHPEQYFNGSAPLNVTGHNVHCTTPDFENCSIYRPDDRDSFLWYDELHPSEQTWRMVAREFVKTMRGKGRWAKFWEAT